MSLKLTRVESKVRSSGDIPNKVVGFSVLLSKEEFFREGMRGDLVNHIQINLLNIF